VTSGRGVRPPVVALLVAGVAVVAIVIVLLVAGDDGARDSRALPAQSPYPRYHRVSDDSGAIEVDVPVAWREVSGAPLDTGASGHDPYVQASSDLDAYRHGFDTAGLEILVVESSRVGEDHSRLLAEIAARSETADCTEEEPRQAFDQRGFEGFLDVFSDCGPNHAQLWLVAAAPRDTDRGVVVVGIKVLTTADREAAERALSTFTVTG